MIKVCQTCEINFSKPYNCSKKSWESVKFCSRKCKHLWMKTITGEKHHSWKGGTIVHGYKIIRNNGKSLREHRIVMENHIGRKLLSSESVHHIDGNKLNNDISNLELLTKKTHGNKHYPAGSLFGINKGKKQLLTKEQISKRKKEYNKQRYLKQKELKQA